MPRVSLPKRSRKYGVGKEIGGAVYLHRAYEHLLGALLTAAREHIPADFAYTVVKYNTRTGRVTFIHSPDFNSSPEPVVGDAWSVATTGDAVFLEQAADPFVYHHKWLFVAEDYAGFDVETSRARSEAWMALPDVDRSRIGKRSFWEGNVLPRLEAAQ